MVFTKNPRLVIWRHHSGNKFKIPEINENLAELVGVIIGDGTLTKNLLRISGDARYDMHFFQYLSTLIHNLFGLSPVIERDNRLEKNTIYLRICSKNLCEFFYNFGISYGDKSRGIIPECIINDNKLLTSCLRGLVDTDGTFSRRSTYMCLEITIHNKLLMEQIVDVNKSLKLFTYKFENNIGTNSRKNIIKFFEVVGSSNLSRIIRFNEWYNFKKRLYKFEIKNLQNEYKNTELPFKLRAGGLVV